MVVDFRRMVLTANNITGSELSERGAQTRMPWFAILGVATLLIGIGLLGDYFVAHGSVEGSFADKTNFWLLGPGYFVAILLGFLGFLRGGAHSAGELFWLAAPISWMFYVLLGVLIFWLRRKIQRRGVLRLNR